ncbi:hypothetical protein [Streptomyces sp. NPDC006879]|uniref:hypothetical protein n=1 Tax=Streptomyces sp. NPDC006879 TaxID=3364767 RepID=UPI0036BB94F9
MAADRFDIATGDGPAPAKGPARDAEVRGAFESLLQIRRLVNHPGGASVPAPWELRQAERAVALSLEAAGIPPSATGVEGLRTATGYRVARGEDRVVRVHWLGPVGAGAGYEQDERLAECRAVLTRLGWEALLYRGPKNRRYLEIELAPNAGRSSR